MELGKFNRLLLHLCTYDSTSIIIKVLAQAAKPHQGHVQQFDQGSVFKELCSSCMRIVFEHQSDPEGHEV